MVRHPGDKTRDARASSHVLVASASKPARSRLTAKPGAGMLAQHASPCARRPRCRRTEVAAIAGLRALVGCGWWPSVGVGNSGAEGALACRSVSTPTSRSPSPRRSRPVVVRPCAWHLRHRCRLHLRVSTWSRGGGRRWFRGDALIDDEVRLVVPLTTRSPGRESKVADLSTLEDRPGSPVAPVVEAISRRYAARPVPHHRTSPSRPRDYVAVMGLISEGWGSRSCRPDPARCSTDVVALSINPPSLRRIEAVTTPDLSRVPAVKAT